MNLKLSESKINYESYNVFRIGEVIEKNNKIKFDKTKLKKLLSSKNRLGK